MTLRALGCERFQGYLFAKPLSAEDVGQVLGRPASAMLSAG